jgi:hypothetical protein
MVGALDAGSPIACIQAGLAGNVRGADEVLRGTMTAHLPAGQSSLACDSPASSSIDKIRSAIVPPKWCVLMNVQKQTREQLQRQIDTWANRAAMAKQQGNEDLLEQALRKRDQYKDALARLQEFEVNDE